MKKTVIGLMVEFAVLALGVLVGSVAQLCNITTHNITEQGKTHMTTIENGDFQLQAIMRFTIDPYCSTITRDGVLSIFTIKYAIEEINRNDQLLPWVKLGYQMDDSCESVPVTMARGIETVSLHRPDSVCRKDFEMCGKIANNTQAIAKPVTAVIGTRLSFTSIPLASLLNLYKIPLISPSSSSRLLENPEFESFFRTIPSDVNQARVMLDIIKYFNWNYVYAIGSDDDYGKLGIAELKEKAPARNICIANDAYIPFRAGNMTRTKIQQIVMDLKNTMKAQVVVLFCYPGDMGDLILEEAARQGITRTWLTSEAWHPSALTIKAPTEQKMRIISVSLKTDLSPVVNTRIGAMMRRDYKCDAWLNWYIRSSFNCTVESIEKDFFNGIGSGCPVSAAAVVNSILYPSTYISENTIDAVYAIAYGIQAVMMKRCKNDSSCARSLKVDPRELTQSIRSVSFVNAQGKHIAFTESRDPLHARYVIEMIQEVKGSLAFVSIGNWNRTRRPELFVNNSAIRWPNGKPVESDCSKPCQPGEREIARTGCCWECQKCPPRTYSEVFNAKQCLECPPGKHTKDGIKCVTTRILHLDFTNAEGISVMAMGIMGFVATIVAAMIVYALRRTIVVKETMPALTGFSFLLLGVAFAYNIMHIVHPTVTVCYVRFGYFFQIFVLLSGLLLVKTRAVTQFLIHHTLRLCRGSLFLAQLAFLFLLFVIEMLAVIIWLLSNPVKVQTYTAPKEFDIWLYCEQNYTASVLLTAFLPGLLLLLATVYAFRERNLEQAYHEPKFLSFTCIALCLTSFAFLPTYRYVVGYYKSIVLAFTVNLFAFIFFACLVLPKIYASLVHAKDEVDVADLGPAFETERQVSVPGMSGNFAATGADEFGDEYKKLPQLDGEDSVVALTKTKKGEHGSKQELRDLSAPDFDSSAL